MENKNKQAANNINIKKYEEPEIRVILLDKNDIVAASGACDCDCPANCPADMNGDYCLAAGTRITMADGSAKNIEDIRVGDRVLSFDHEKGCLTDSEAFLTFRGDTPRRAFTLRFSDNTELSIVGVHALFEQESMMYVCISEKNVEEFIGKHFYNAAEKCFTELLSVTYETAETDYYAFYSAGTLNMIANGMLNVVDDVTHTLNIYALDENLKADPKVLADDIQKYGLLPYSAKLGYSEYEFKSFKVKYSKIATCKGLVTSEKLADISNNFFREKKSDQILG